MSTLSEKDRREGVLILMSLQTVERALRLEDATSIQRIAENVVKNEQTKVVFSDFIRRVGTYEYPKQIEVVKSLLPDCFDLNEKRLKQERERKGTLITAG